MNIYTNRRSYSCRICRKAYVRFGSLSIYMKFYYGENRLKKFVCCEFCVKVFGYVRVYFGYLKEVYRVVISIEFFFSDLLLGDMVKSKDVNVRALEGSVER